MQTFYLPFFLFQKVLESESITVMLFLDHSIQIGEQVRIIQYEGSKNYGRYPSFLRFVTNFDEAEYVNENEVIVSITLSSTNIPVTSKSYGYQLHL
jgi:hypothetical protein